MEVPVVYSTQQTTSTKWKNFLAFWLFGLTSNYSFVVMLSGAFDIIHNLEKNRNTTLAGDVEDADSPYNDSCTPLFNYSSNSSSYQPRQPCQTQGTAVCSCALVFTDLGCYNLQVILLADVLPAFLIKSTAVYFINFIPYW